MSELEAKQYPDSVYWQAESFRLTAFLSPSAQSLEQDWWKNLTSTVPDRITSEPRTGLQQVEGKFKDERIEGKLFLTIQPTRVDWQLVPLLDNFESGIPILGSFTESLDSFFILMRRWIEIAPPIQRLAFGAILNKPVNSYKEGSNWLSSYLPFDFDEDSSDFMYQINRPRKSNVTGNSELLINRLSKWSVSLLAGFALEPNQSEQYIIKPNKYQFSVRLELDINTQPNFSIELTSEQLPQIFKELVEFGKEITTQGDIK